MALISGVEIESWQRGHLPARKHVMWGWSGIFLSHTSWTDHLTTSSYRFSRHAEILAAALVWIMHWHIEMQLLTQTIPNRYRQ